MSGVGAGEVPAVHDRDAYRLEVAEADRVHLHEHAVAGGGVGAFRKDASGDAPGEWRALRDGRAAYAGERADPLDELIVEDAATLGCVAFPTQVEVHDQHALRLEPGIDGLRVAADRAGTGRPQ